MDVNRARKAELIAFAEERGWNTEGTVLELRARIKMSLESKDAVEESEGAVSEMFPELETLSDEDVSEAMNEDIPEESDLKEAECPDGFHWYAEAGECVPDDASAEEEELDEADAEAVEAEIPDVPFAEDDEFTEEISKVHTPLEPCKNCGTDLERFPPFFDPESDASRCPNCGHGL
ncbi:MAG: hypothetical protein V3W28_06365 [Thermoplasmata archaeon]